MPYEVHCAELSGNWNILFVSVDWFKNLCTLLSDIAWSQPIKFKLYNLWKLFCHLCVVCNRWSMNSLWVCHLRVRLHNTFLNWVCSQIVSRPLNILLMWKNRKAERITHRSLSSLCGGGQEAPHVIQDSAQESVHHQRLDEAWISC